MDKVLNAILHQLEMLTITGKEAERMAAIKSMVRDLITAIKAAEAPKEGDKA